jgi:chromate transporter
MKIGHAFVHALTILGMDRLATPGDVAPPPSVGALFAGFLTLGLTGFGGVLPLARRLIVEDRRWLSAAEFTELLGLCQFLPGGNVINLSVAIGLRFRGVAGAFASLIGLLAAPTAIVVALGMVYERYASDPHVRHTFAGLAAAAAGLLIAMAVKLALPIRGNLAAIAVALFCFFAIAVLGLPLLPTMIALAAFSVVVTWKWPQ